MPPEPVFTAQKGSFLYKTASDEATWTRLRSPTEPEVRYTNYREPRFNVYKIRFDSGVTLTQTDQKHRITCNVKLILEPPCLKMEGEQLTVEAKCVEISDPAFCPHDNCADRQQAVEHAKELPLAQLDKTITAGTVVKLENFCHYRSSKIEGRIDMIDTEIEKGYASWSTAQSNGSTEPPQTTNGLAATPGPPHGFYMATPATEWSLQEHLNAHRLRMWNEEVRLRHNWNENKKNMLRDVSAAIETECERQWGVIHAEHQAKARETFRQIRRDFG